MAMRRVASDRIALSPFLEGICSVFMPGYAHDRYRRQAAERIAARRASRASDWEMVGRYLQGAVEKLEASGELPHVEEEEQKQPVHAR